MAEDLKNFFEPRGIAVIGASPKRGSVGYVIVDQLKKRYRRGRIYPVNPKYSEILGLKAYPTILDVPDPVDLAVVAVRADRVPSIVEQIGKRGVKAAIVISGGFSEIGPEGAERERKLLEIARRYGIRIIGPNCIGVLDNTTGIDTFFLPEDRLRRPPLGSISIISQSGAMLSMWVDWMAMKGLGLAKAVSYGNKVDVDDVELLRYLIDDPHTKVILMYIEALKPRRGKEFIEVARSATVKGKPVVVLKGGRSGAGARAAASHTGALASNYEVYRAAFKQAGIIEADTMEEMFDIAKAFTMTRPAEGRRLLILTNAGGEGVIATDFAERYGLEVPVLPEELQQRLRAKMPPHVVVKNPVDLTGDTDDERYRIVLEEVLPENIVDIVIVIAPPHPPAIRGDVINYVAEAHKKYQAPMLAVVTGGYIAEEYSRKFEAAGIPAYPSPERAIRVAAALAYYGEYVKKRGSAKY
ncbi:MAG: CoA-binding protein [Thermoprotei archaeon]|nr:MAG: CoA-binding protein [Thermoprotei archaeon]